MTDELVQQLLYCEESDSLDFKSSQYKFTGATDREKGELLKDILAFANSWCQCDAHILIGVKEEKGAKSTVVGITENLDDADIQQFVNKKLNRPMLFSYRTIGVDGLTIGLITIPRQSRPFYLMKEFGGLKPNVAYVRRGSSTDEASLDEVSLMKTSSTPSEETSLDLSLQVEDTRTLGKAIRIRTHSLRYDTSEIPFYGGEEHPLALIAVYRDRDNRNFYSQYAQYEKQTSLIRGFRFHARNTGGTLLKNVTVKMRAEGECSPILVPSNKYPRKPRRTSSIIDGISQEKSLLVNTRSIAVKRELGKPLVEGRLLDVQPKDSVTSDEPVYIGLWESGSIEFVATVFADNLSTPLEFRFTIEVEVVPVQLDIQAFINHLDENGKTA